MADIRIMIDVGNPEPASENKHDHAVPKKPTVEEKVREALECIESGFESHVEWTMINKLYKDLIASPKKNERMQNIISMIAPILKKYGYHGVSSEDK